MNTQVIQSMFKHLVQSYTADEARDILLQKYPTFEDTIKELKADDVQMREVATPTLKEKAVKVVKEKVAKPKAVKIAKTTNAPKGESKRSQALALYNGSTDQSRKAIIQLFVSKLGLSATAASTYHHWCKTTA